MTPENGLILGSEIWKPIVDYEGLYEISSSGRIRALNWGKYKCGIKILKTRVMKSGYEQGWITKDNKQKLVLIHRLVAQSFIENPHSYPQINHKDECKLNNKVENLEWCTPSYNMTFSFGKSISQFTLNGEFIKTWSSNHELCKFGFDRHHVRECCIGKYNSHKGYKWKYDE